MDKNEIITGIVSLMVLAVLFGTAFITAVGAIEEDNQTTYNNAVLTNKTFKLDGADNYIFETNPNTSLFKINNEYWVAKNGTTIITDKCRVDLSGHYITLYDETGNRSSNINSSNKNVVVTYTADTKTFTYTVYTDLTNTTVENSYTYSVENILYVVAKGGDYGAISTNGNPDVTYYVNDLSQVIAGGAYTSGALDTSYFAEGLTVYVGNTSYNASSSANTENVINGVIKGSSYTVTVTDGVNSEVFTPYTVFVPLSVKGTTDNQQSFNDLIGILPLVVGAGLLLLAVAYFIRRY